MVEIIIKKFNTRKVINLFSGIPKAFQEEIGQKATLKIAESAKRRIRRRYALLGYGTSPHSTGAGLKSILIKPTDKGWALSVADYLRLLDRRIATHWVSMDTIEAHRANPGSTMFKKAPRGYQFSRPPILFTWRGPFISPAIKALSRDIPRILEKQINVAMQKAKS